MKKFLMQYFLYLVRWQLSTPILAPCIALFGGATGGVPILATVIANLIGGLIFFWVDKLLIFKKG